MITTSKKKIAPTREPQSATRQRIVGLPPNVRVLMADGHLREVGKIVIGDMVRTAEGHGRAVVAVRSQVVEQMYRLEVDGGRHIRLAPSHELLTPSGYLPAEDLRVGDQVSGRFSCGRSFHRIVSIDPDPLYLRGPVVLVLVAGDGSIVAEGFGVRADML
jgi:hypothetical protein